MWQLRHLNTVVAKDALTLYITTPSISLNSRMVHFEKMVHKWWIMLPGMCLCWYTQLCGMTFSVGLGVILTWLVFQLIVSPFMDDAQSCSASISKTKALPNESIDDFKSHKATAISKEERPAFLRSSCWQKDLYGGHAYIKDSFERPDSKNPHRLFYLVEIFTRHGLKWTVARSYNDFRQLKKELHMKIVAKFPPKLPFWIHAKQDQYPVALKEREILLNGFLAALINDPVYASHRATRSFFCGEKCSKSDEEKCVLVYDREDDDAPIIGRSSDPENFLFRHLSVEQQDAMRALRSSLVRLDIDSPERKYADSAACLQRFLDANDWNVEHAQTALHATLKWRKSMHIDKLEHRYASILEQEHTSGKIYVADFVDKLGHGILVVRPHLDYTHDLERNLITLLFNIERAHSLSLDQKITLVIDLTYMNLFELFSFKMAIELIKICSLHYVEVLHKAVILNAPWSIRRMLKLYLHLILQASTQRKICFVSEEELLTQESPLKMLLDTVRLSSHVGSHATFQLQPTKYLSYMDQCTLQVPEGA